MSEWQEFKPKYKVSIPRKWYQFWKPKLEEQENSFISEYKREGKIVKYRVRSK